MDYPSRVLDGEILVGPHVRAACDRHFADLKSGIYRWDQDAAQRAMDFFPEMLPLSKGEHEGKPFKLFGWQEFVVGSLFGWKRTNGTRRFRKAYIEQAKGSGKALALDTPIPTPSGWTTMGELRAGDQVFSPSGRAVTVQAVHPVDHDLFCYEVAFDGGEKVVASGDHLWHTEMRKSPEWFHTGARRPQKGVPMADRGNWRHGLRTTQQIAETQSYRMGSDMVANHSIPVAAPLKQTMGTSTSVLPIPAYTLGAWLGDGNSDLTDESLMADRAPPFWIV